MSGNKIIWKEINRCEKVVLRPSFFNYKTTYKNMIVFRYNTRYKLLDAFIL